MRPLSLVACMLFAVAPQMASAAEPEAKARVDFNRDIRPILSDVCFQCHGPDKNQRKADLRLDLKEEVYKDRGGYQAVVPGKLDESELYSRLIETDPKLRMPPPDALRQLSPADIDTFKRWIEEGAQWKGHWAYIAPERSRVPVVTDEKHFVRNDIDWFILRKLQTLGLEPSSEADRVTLIRRLSFDLTGLPPEPQAVAAFVADASPQAYEKLVDGLLASPQFGERMAMAWLDLVRYADTNGYHGDNHEDRDMYRDWVIRAFNDNLPFDRFTVEQLAGDLLPQATTEQRIASGYNRLLMTTREGGAQAKEYLAKYSADRVRNFSAVWLAGTMGCCECHDHKYDPYTTRDFYSLAAFFADLQETAVGEQPGTKIPTPDQAMRLARFDEQLAPMRKVLDTQTPQLDRAQAAWEESVKPGKITWTVLKPVEAKSALGATLKVLDDGTTVATGENTDRDTYELTFKGVLKGVTALRLEVLPDDTLPAKGPGRSDNGNFVLNEFAASVGGSAIDWSAVTATHSQKEYDITAAIDGKPETGWAILPQVGRSNQAIFETKTDLGDGSEVTLAVTMQQNFGFRHTIGRFQIAATSAPRPIRADARNGVPQNIVTILDIEPAKRTDAQKSQLAAHFRTLAPELEPARKQLAELQKERDAFYKSIRTTLVSMSGPPRMIRILPRGNWLDDSGEEAVPAAPAFLTPRQAQPADSRLTRLDLAKWLVSPENPTTARVFVNRLWKIGFGQGLVKSTEDFGAQGTPPSHPDLLDWLALEFASPATDGALPEARPWDVKRILKLIVMSATYRQSSHAGESLRQRDPFNQWLARQGRFRLDAEMVRDNALAVSGLLVQKLGGPSAKPYQPPLYWSYLNFPTREWQADQGDGLYRRGLYTYWCRTFLHPALKAFDAPTREECTADRPRSNTPLQALVLLNDPSYVEAARALAERIIKGGGADTESRIRFAYLQVLSRQPRDEELKLLTGLCERHLSQYQADPPAAGELLKIGNRPVPADLTAAELAAWTSVARVLLNLHETVTRN